MVGVKYSARTESHSIRHIHLCPMSVPSLDVPMSNIHFVEFSNVDKNQTEHNLAYGPLVSDYHRAFGQDAILKSGVHDLLGAILAMNQGKPTSIVSGRV